MENSLVVLKKKPSISKVIDILLYLITAISIIILILSLIIIVKKIVNPKKVPDVFGIKPFIVLSGSMEPSIKVGDLTFIKNVDIDQLQIGDIIAFRYTDEDIIILHRITEKDTINNELIFRTKGDNNENEDKLNVKKENIEGVYSGRIANIGNFALFIQTPSGLMCALLAVIVIFVFWQIIKIKKEENILDKKLKESIEYIKELKKGEEYYV